LQKQEEINLYGIDGSKPGAAAAGVWLSHRAIGLHENGISFLINMYSDKSRVADLGLHGCWTWPHFNIVL
jgi:hypothetical protein